LFSEELYSAEGFRINKTFAWFFLCFMLIEPIV